MAELTARDLRVLDHYAAQGNRELYWNYLANTPGNDGYGLLALGVVRNDNMPGKTANTYARGIAEETRPGMTERDWEAVGVDLMRNDLATRSQLYESGRRDQALNLPGSAVAKVHDETFELAGIDREAWTPRKLMLMAEERDGPQAVERIWNTMLDNTAAGTYRAASTIAETYDYTDKSSARSVAESGAYAGRLSAAWAQAGVDRPHSDPDIIGAQRVYHERDDATGAWNHVVIPAGTIPLPFRRPVRDPAMIEQLDDARNLRLERQELRTQFHPDDPYREIARSPWSLADNQAVPDSRDPQLAGAPPAAGRTAMADMRVDPLYQHVQQSLQAHLPAGSTVSHERIAQLTHAAQQVGIQPGERIHIAAAGTRLTLHGEHPSHVAAVDLRQPPPAAAGHATPEAQRMAADAELHAAHRPAQAQPHAMHM